LKEIVEDLKIFYTIIKMMTKVKPKEVFMGKPASCITIVPKGRRVCWKSFRAAPLNVSLLRYPAIAKCHLG